MPFSEQEAVVKELDGYIEAKIGLTKIVDLSDKTTRIIVQNIYQVTRVNKPTESEITKTEPFSLKEPLTEVELSTDF